MATGAVGADQPEAGRTASAAALAAIHSLRVSFEQNFMLYL
jgi:hypothetical protein